MCYLLLKVHLVCHCGQHSMSSETQTLTHDHLEQYKGCLDVLVLSYQFKQSRVSEGLHNSAPALPLQIQLEMPTRHWSMPQRQQGWQ